MGNESKQCLDEDAAAAVAAAAVSGAIDTIGTIGFIVNMIIAIPKPNVHTISNCSTSGCCGTCGIGVGFGFLFADSDNLATEVETNDPRPFKFEYHFVFTPNSLIVNSYM